MLISFVNYTSQFIAIFKISFFTSKIYQSICIFLYDNVPWKLFFQTQSNGKHSKC